MSEAQPTIFAATGNRAAALLLDLFLLVVVAGFASEAGLAYPVVFPVLAFLYFAGMPLSPLQGTLGKWICRIKLCDRLGRRLTWRASVLRTGATMCWFGLPVVFGDSFLMGATDGPALSTVWWLLFALPWAPAGFLPRHESLFDRLAGSLVVRYRADTESVARAEPAQKPGFSNVVGTVLLCLTTGAILGAGIAAQNDMNRRARVGYAFAQTESLRQAIEVFHEREQRWPTAGELGVPEWTPYRDGGGYRLQTGGRILITFAVLPELKGHSLTLRPMRAAKGRQIDWRCLPDPGFKRMYLPSMCR